MFIILSQKLKNHTSFLPVPLHSDSPTDFSYCAQNGSKTTMTLEVSFEPTLSLASFSIQNSAVFGTWQLWGEMDRPQHRTDFVIATCQHRACRHINAWILSIE